MVDEHHAEYNHIARFYDHILPHSSRSDVHFYLTMASKYGGPVLELGCGTGRVLLPTARAGIHITGLDLSQSMLDICREKLHREPHAVSDRVNLVQGNMTSFALAEQFRLITIPFRSFQHLVTVEGQLT